MPLLCSCACAHSQDTEPSEEDGELLASREGTGHLWGHTTALGSSCSPHMGPSPASCSASGVLEPKPARAPGILTAILHLLKMSTSQQLLTFSSHKLQGSRSSGWEPSWSPHRAPSWGHRLPTMGSNGPWQCSCLWGHHIQEP